MAEVDLNAAAAEDEAPAQGDDLYDGWGDDSDIVAAEDEEEAADSAATEDEEESESENHTEEEPKSEEAESNDVPAAEEKPAAEVPKYKLKHMDSEQELTAEEMIPLAQKGMDYDRIRKERDSMKKDYAKFKERSEFLERIKGKFSSVEDLMDDTDATLLVKNEAGEGRTVSKDEALKRVKTNRESKEAKLSEKSPNAVEIDNFIADFVSRGQKPPAWSDIPEEVREEFERTGKIIGPYYRHMMSKKDSEISKKDDEISQKSKELETLKQNAKNKERSTGSRVTKGKSATKNSIFDGWGDD